MNSELGARLLLTAVAASFGVIGAGADLNRTHARNPLWTGHARFHVVWQTATHIALGAAVLAILWTPVVPIRTALLLASTVCTVVLVSFFGAMATMRFYGGRLNDSNGYAPLRRAVGTRTLSVDLNVLLFSTATAALVVAVCLILR